MTRVDAYLAEDMVYKDIEPFVLSRTGYFVDKNEFKKKKRLQIIVGISQEALAKKIQGLYTSLTIEDIESIERNKSQCDVLMVSDVTFANAETALPKLLNVERIQVIGRIGVWCVLTFNGHLTLEQLDTVRKKLLPEIMIGADKDSEETDIPVEVTVRS